MYCGERSKYSRPLPRKSWFPSSQLRWVWARAQEKKAPSAACVNEIGIGEARSGPQDETLVEARSRVATLESP
jgi:hypothetical protein